MERCTIVDGNGAVEVDWEGEGWVYEGNDSFVNVSSSWSNFPR
jgi:hypothetical protein